MIDLNLYKKVYSPDDVYSSEYSCFEWGSEKSKNKYYKKVPVKVTDEEYEEIKKYSGTKEVGKKSNFVANLLKFIAWIFYVFGFLSVFFIEVDGFGIILVYWFVYFAGGTMYLAFAEIIKLLMDIKNK